MLRATLHQNMPADYRCTPASIARAKTEAAKERAEVDAAFEAAEQERHAAILVLTEMVETFSLPTVQRWMRALAAGGAR